MIMGGCQSKSKEITIAEKICPQCGSVIELFSVDTDVACEKCGFVAYNDGLSCIQWCEYARQCVGDEVYEKMMQVAAEQKRKWAEERMGMISEMELEAVS
jgi:ribosomal protein S27AE